MALRLIYPAMYGPCGLFDIKDGISVEGGNVGQFADGSGNTTPVDVCVDLYSDDANPLILLIDDSTTGSGYGTLFGSKYGDAAMSVSTTAASGKCSAWTAGGIYATDVYASDITESTAVNTKLYSYLSGANQGKLTAGSGAGIGTQVVGYFLDHITKGDYLMSLVGVEGGDWIVFQKVGV